MTHSVMNDAVMPLKLVPYFKDTVCLWLAIVATVFFIAMVFILVFVNTCLQDTKV